MLNNILSIRILRSVQKKLYYDICAIAARVLHRENTSHSVPDTSRVPTSPTFVLVLSKIELPKFDGSLTQRRPFRDKFTSLICRNNSIGGIDRFHYLLSCLSGTALSVINSLPVMEDNINIAWMTLSMKMKTIIGHSTFGKIIRLPTYGFGVVAVPIEFREYISRK